jgi:hypothetical protein
MYIDLGAHSLYPLRFLNEITAQRAEQTISRNTLNNMSLTPSQSAASPMVPGKKSVQKKAGSGSTAKSKSRKKVVAQPSVEQVALRAYFIAERRRNLGIPGDETSDWVEAEREILEELKAK